MADPSVASLLAGGAVLPAADNEDSNVLFVGPAGSYPSLIEAKSSTRGGNFERFFAHPRQGAGREPNRQRPVGPVTARPSHWDPEAAVGGGT
jgi:hypothetical protein